jgi:hypothetical protein
MLEDDIRDSRHRSTIRRAGVERVPHSHGSHAVGGSRGSGSLRSAMSLRRMNFFMRDFHAELNALAALLVEPRLFLRIRPQRKWFRSRRHHRIVAAMLASWQRHGTLDVLVSPPNCNRVLSCASWGAAGLPLSRIAFPTSRPPSDGRVRSRRSDTKRLFCSRLLEDSRVVLG